MNSFLNLLLLIPLFSFLISLVLPPKSEKLISVSAYYFVGLHFVCLLVFMGYWAYLGFPVLSLDRDIEIYSTGEYEFYVSLFFDNISAVYLFVGSFLTFLIIAYSRTYMHRESGYKRFFNTILFFYLGYNLIVLSGNFETLFIGWEILGVSSFLLIAFYRNRYLPVKNAVKVFSVYRIGDVGIILAMWMSHHLWHENITFIKIENYDLVHHQLESHSYVGIFISLMILVSATAKSAQLPFSSWLPRAMEGPTPSSAIFYGSLAVNIGVFLLLRTFPFWEHQTSVRILIALIGLSTSIIASGIARVQSSIKSQIAYSSISQIGLIFIEVAAGFEYLALFHFAGNAFLRTYQLLVSPSVITYKIREQFFNFKARPHTIEASLPKRIEYSFYILCLKEWNLDTLMYRFLWNPMKAIGNKLNFLSLQRVILYFIPMYLIGLGSLYFEDSIPETIHKALPVFFALIGLLMVLKAFTERIHARMSYMLVVLNHFWIVLAISFNEHYNLGHSLMYLSGIAVSAFVGFLCLVRLKKLEGNIDLNQFHGHSYFHPKLTMIFFVACLGISGFPVTPTFIAEDVIFTHIREEQIFLAFFISLSFIIDGFAIIRIFARVFLGPHARSPHEMAHRSS